MYCKACSLCESGDYETGIAVFVSLGDFKDSAYRIIYYNARACEEQAGTDEWEYMVEAEAFYRTIPVFLDSAERIAAIKTRIETARAGQYQAAVQAGKTGDYATAQKNFERLGEYSDSAQRYTYYGIRADEAALADSADQDALLAVAKRYSAMGKYLDCADRTDAVMKKANGAVADKYAKVNTLIDEGKYEDAEAALASFGSYGNDKVNDGYNTIADKYLAQWDWDAASKVYYRRYGWYASLAVYYVKAETLLAEGKWDEASEAFGEAFDYQDARSRINEPYYRQAEALMADGEWKAASKAFEKAGTYSDAADRVGESFYKQAESLLAVGDEDGAIAAFKNAGSYSDATRRW